MVQGTGSEFLKKTKYPSFELTDQVRGVPQPPLEREPEPGKRIVPLPAPDSIRTGPLDLREAIDRRRSVRDYDHRPLSLDELSLLLWSTQGVEHVDDDRTVTFRTVPSSGARHALETYLLVNDVEGLEPGLYRYLALEHRLVEESVEPNIAIRINGACQNQTFILRSGVTFLWVADIYLMTWRYGERGYRDIFLDAGHVCQNLYLTAELMGCGVCAVSAFGDEAMNRILGLDGEERFLVYLATVGKKYGE